MPFSLLKISSAMTLTLALGASGAALEAPPGAAASPPGTTAPFRFQAGQIGVYEGTARGKQIVGDEAPEASEYRAHFFFKAREAAPGTYQLLAVRLLVPQGGGQEPLIGFDELHARLDSRGALALEQLPQGSPELDESSQGLRIFFPIDFWPALVLPAGKPVRAESEVSILGLLETRIPVEISAASEGERLEITRKIVEGAKPKLEIQGEAATLPLWRERYLVEAATGALLQLEKEVALEFKYNDAKVRIERSLALEAKSVRIADGAEAKLLDALEGDLRGILADFHAVKPADEISKRVALFEKVAAEKAGGKSHPFETPARALAARLKPYRKFFEESDEGRQLARILGKPAPDFTLESLDGKQVKFREATQGKVTLLSFWGVG